MVRSGYIVENPIFLQQPFEQLVAKVGSPSLIMALVVPNLENMLFFKKAVTLFPSLFASAMAPSILTDNQPPQKFSSSYENSQKGP